MPLHPVDEDFVAREHLLFGRHADSLVQLIYECKMALRQAKLDGRFAEVSVLYSVLSKNLRATADSCDEAIKAYDERRGIVTGSPDDGEGLSLLQMVQDMQDRFGG